MNGLIVKRRPEILISDDKRVITRQFNLGKPERIQGLITRVQKLKSEQVEPLLETVMQRFSSRHRDLETTLRENCKQVLSFSHKARRFSDRQKLLLGAYVTLEYSFESAALFNPSMVPHPDQSGLEPGCLRFLMSLRATGEGHLSSIVFRRGIVDATGDIHFDPPPRYAFPGTPIFSSVQTDKRLEPLLKQCRPAPRDPQAYAELREKIMWQIAADYRVSFPKDCKPSEIVIFPGTRFESRGVEDLRLVRFQDGDKVEYLGTYTAYDGATIHPMLITSTDFHDFHVSPMFGTYAKNKGIAIFPRKINGRYCAISRHDSQNLFLLRSKDMRVWNQADKLMEPKYPWELIQLGNCGSPIETEAGWLLITHGVGPMREYGIGIALLDRDDPSIVIARLPEPIIAANEDERAGYVPNVVYSCGSLIHNGELIIPYAMSDSRTAFATIGLENLLDTLKKHHVQST